eukprot:GEMP01015518.1.p1 GENE.GEMP01015518.1~~GEMP01015518.1.p1  ORF type:complete len:652 (+),score=147.83 GEMP01015518.1:91-2046(+)
MRTLIVKSKYGNIRGAYERLGSSGTAWQCPVNKVFLYHGNECWVIGKENGGKSFLSRSRTDGASPAGLEWDDNVNEVSELKTGDSSKCPKNLVVLCKFGNLKGGYRRMAKDRYGYPQYENSDDGVFLWHDPVKGNWIFSQAIDPAEGYFFSLENSAIDPTTIAIDEWGENFTAVDALPWDVDAQNPATFVDEEFPPNKQCVGDVPVNWDNVEWIRCGDLVRGESMVLFDKIEPTDLLQGEVGDCWLVAAIAGLAEFPSAVMELFPYKKATKDGKYEVRLYDVRISDFVIITIDDYVPCRKRAWWEQRGHPLFAKAVGNELWAILIEKAIAKFAGSFGDLNGGQTGWAWQCLTGCTKQVMMSKKPDGWAKFIVDAKVQREEMAQGDRRSLPFFRKVRDDKRDTEALFYTLVKGDLKGYLMSASIGGDEVEFERTDGLVERHAYTVIQVIEIEDQRLLKLRNPWGNSKEWNGSWSDESDLWQKHEGIRTALNHVVADDGTFWMNFEDFREIFTGVNICPSENICIANSPRLHPRPPDFLIEKLKSGMDLHIKNLTMKSMQRNVEPIKEEPATGCCGRKKRPKAKELPYLSDDPAAVVPGDERLEGMDLDPKKVQKVISKLKKEGLGQEEIIEKLEGKGMNRKIIEQQLHAMER